MEYGCIGEKLTHSFSKEIHGELFDYEYELMEISRDNLPDFIKSKGFRAINVTIPYKQAVIPFLDEISETAKNIGAVNTIVNKNVRLCGYNTDFFGMKSLIERNGIDISGKKVLILGSGGTSKTALAVAKYFGAKEVYRVSRGADNDCIAYETAIKKHTDAQIIINTTPVGMYPNNGEYPIDIEAFGSLQGVVDAIYNPLRSALIARADSRGIKTAGGLFMLVAQGAQAAGLFTGIKVSEADTERVYKKIEQSKKNIVLIGMPGSGKTTIGKALAKRLGMSFLDTDALIEESWRKTPAQIIEQEGEEKFRNLEAQAVRQAAKSSHTVIATGGGAVLNEQNIIELRGNGVVYFIDRPLLELAVTADRPLSKTTQLLKCRFDERYEIYCKSADVILKASGEITDNTEKIVKDFMK